MGKFLCFEKNYKKYNLDFDKRINDMETIKKWDSSKINKI